MANTRISDNSWLAVPDNRGRISLAGIVPDGLVYDAYRVEVDSRGRIVLEPMVMVPAGTVTTPTIEEGEVAYISAEDEPAVWPTEKAMAPDRVIDMSNPDPDGSAAAAGEKYLTPEARRHQPQGGQTVVELMPGSIGVSPTGLTSRPYAESELAARITALSSTRALGDRQ